MTTYSADPEVDAAAAVFAARGYSVSEAIRLAHLQVSEARNATPLTKVLPTDEYGPLGGMA